MTDIAFANQRFGWVVGWKGIIYHTHNSGREWQKQASSTEIDLKQIVFVDNKHGWAMGWNMLDPKTQTWPPVFLRTTDGGNTWNAIGRPSLWLHSITFVDAQNGWALVIDDRHNAKLARTNDGGITWASQLTPKSHNWDTVHFLNVNEGWALGDRIIQTADGGDSWRYQSTPRTDLTYERISFAGKYNGAVIRVGAMDTLEGWGYPSDTRWWASLAGCFETMGAADNESGVSGKVSRLGAQETVNYSRPYEAQQIVGRERRSVFRNLIRPAMLE